MDKEVLIAAIGVGGTLLGTVLGWFLNHLTNMGRLSIFVGKWTEEFSKNQGGINEPSESLEQTEYYAFSLSLDLYNSSGATRIMRNIKIIHAHGRNLLRSETPCDEATKRHSCGTTRYDKVEPVNIPPKTVMKLDLHDGKWNTNGGLGFLKNTTRIYLQYTDERNKCRRKLIAKVNYSDRFTSDSNADA